MDVALNVGNYGWLVKEGSFCFSPNGVGVGGEVTDAPMCGPMGLIDPVAQYDHDEGISVIGGFVSRGSALPTLRGRYVFGDYALLFGSPGRLFALKKRNIVRPQQILDSKLIELQLANQADLGRNVLGFGQDANGELYVLTNTTGVPTGTTGEVLKILKP